MTKLREEDVMAADVMERRGRSIRSLAEDFEVDERTLRYRLQRLRSGAEDGRDGRQRQREACAAFDDVVVAWLAAQAEGMEGGLRPEPVMALYEALVSDHGYGGSYKAVVRYVRRRQAPLRVRPSRRVEMRPGAQAQVDWVQQAVWVDALGGLVKLWAFAVT
jgi:hypothetical protein